MSAFIFLVLSFVFGVFLFHWLDNKTSFFNFRFLIFSLGIGLAVSGYAVLVLSLVFKSLFYGLAVFLVLGIIGSGLFFMRFLKILNSRLVFEKPKWREALLFLMAAVTVILGLQAMIFDSQGFPFGILKGWGDGAYHLNMVQRLAAVNPFFLDQPVAGGRVLSYPVLVNFLSAVLNFGGLPLPIAWHLPTVVFGVGLVFGLFHLGKKFLHKSFLAVIFVFLVLFGAGLGYFWFFHEVQKDAGQVGWVNSFFNNFFEPKFEYSHLDTRTGGKLQEKNLPVNIVWVVPAISFFSHQRSFIVGGFLGVLFLLGFIGTFNWRYLFVLGLMPLAHTHSFLALAVFSFVLIVFSNNFKKAFNKVSYLAGLVALPQVVFIYLSLKLNSSYEIVPWFGWMACTHGSDPFVCDANVLGTDSSVLWFWLKNFGVIFIVWLVGILAYSLKKGKAELNELVLPSIVLFVLPNVFLFQPWEFDNNKILFWWWVLAVALSLSLLDSKETSRQFSKKWLSVISYSLLVIFVFSSSFAGVIDVVYRLGPGLKIEKNERSFGYYGEEELKIAGWIKQNTKPNDIFLTTTQPTQFVPMLSGRAIYLGFTGWLWTQGGDSIISGRRAKINEFAYSGDAAKLCSDGTRYWLADQQFFKEYPPSENQVENAGETVFELGQKKIIKLDCGD